MLGNVVKRILLPVAVLLLFMIGLGLLITKVLEHVWPFTVEDGINRGFAAHRHEPWTAISAFFSFVGSTPCIIGVTVLVAIILRLTLHRWREPLFLCAVVSAQALVFFFATLVIDRHRPTVTHLDASPPTSSFPSGTPRPRSPSTSGWRWCSRRSSTRPGSRCCAGRSLLVPVCVAVARLYRGMHHPSDVTASFLNGIACIVIMNRAILDRRVEWRRAGPATPAPTVGSAARA